MEVNYLERILAGMFHFVVHWLQSFGVNISVIHQDSVAQELNLEPRRVRDSPGEYIF
jgi:hypothetical protein